MPEERALLDEIVQLAASRRRALARPAMQQAFTKKLQFWRIVHVPLAFIFLFALFFHVLGAFDVHRKVVPLSIAESGPLAVFKPSQDCQSCHTAIYAQWADSMHAHALNEPAHHRAEQPRHAALARRRAPRPTRGACASTVTAPRSPP